MSNEIRYLLHANPAKYSSYESLLVSKGDSVWQKIAKQMLAKKQELWRLIESELASQIPQTKWESIGIREITDVEVVNLIQEMGTASIDGNELQASERDNLLSFVGKNKQNENLWKELVLHETGDGELVSITGHTYLENPRFSLYTELKGKVKIIKRSETLVQTWIPEWTPGVAIDIMLTQTQPYAWCKLILDAIEKLENDEREKLKEKLRNKAWLFNEQTKSGVLPVDIIQITDKDLEAHANIIISLNQGKYPVSGLPLFVCKHNLFQWLTSLFDKWNARKIINLLLKSNNPHNYCELILDAVGASSLKLTEDLEKDLQHKKWIPIQSDEPKAPINIIYLPKNLFSLQKHIDVVIELSQDAYASETMLPSNILNHKHYPWLKENFNVWDENYIINIIISSNQVCWNQYATIIIDSIDSLLKRNEPIQANNIKSLKSIEWLVDKKGKVVSPDKVISYPDLENEINQILLVAEGEYIDPSMLDKKVTQSKRVFNWLKNNLFIKENKEVFQIIGEILGDVEEYWLGDFQTNDFPLDECWSISERKGVFQDVNTEAIPIWTLTEKISKEEFQKYILPNILQKIAEFQLIKLLNWLSNKYSSPDKAVISVYNKYLEIACHYHNFKDNILPNIQLLNRLEKWKYAKNLCYEVVGIEDDDILNNSQSQILKDFLEQVNKQPETDVSVSIQHQDENNAALLGKYFQSWQTHIKHELIGTFLALLTAGEERVKKLARSYLRKRNLEEVQQRLLESTNVLIRRFKITLGASEDETKLVLSIVGTYFHARLSLGQNPDNIFVGNLNKNTTQLQLRYINPQNFSDHQLSELLKKSCKYFIKQVYGINLKDFDKIWDDLGNSEQLDIEVAKYYILDTIPQVFGMLGMRNINKEINHILRDWDEALFNLATKKCQHDSTESVIKRIDTIVQYLCKVLENEQDGSVFRKDVLTSVRKKIAQHGYLPKSIIFELFQNADDALVEIKKILRGRELEKDRLKFVVSWNLQEISVMHWGRPINLFRHPDYPTDDYRQDGFDRDLVKMLCFNHSDKLEGVTGEFGLGFKSVHLICEQPQVLSGNLGFNVLAGLLPSKFDLTEFEILQEQLKQHNNIPDGTLIKLTIDPQVNIQPTEVIGEFERLAGILLVFSKYIKYCKLVGNQTKEFTWNPSQILGVQGIEAGDVDILRVQGIEAGDVDILEAKDTSNRWIKRKALCIQTEQAKASLLICLEEASGKIKSCLQQFPTIWVTAPTKENLELGFILNAKFNINTGREKLSRFEENLSLAEEIGQSIGHQLCKLFQMTENNWTAVRDALGLSETDKYTFWKFIWQELAVNWLNKDENDSLKLIRQVLGGTNGMGYLATQCAILPSGLWGNYRQLLALQNIAYTVRGILATEEYFKVVSQWPEFNKKCSGSVILERTWNELKKLIGSSPSLPVQKLMLFDVIKWELGSKDGILATPQTAEMLAQLVTPDFLTKLEKSEQLEYKEITDFLNKEVQFLSKNNSTDFYSAHLLLVAEHNSDTSQESSSLEEKLLAAFAPDDKVLNPKYTNNAVKFFYACRGQTQSVNFHEIANWALKAESEAKRTAVRNYLLNGERKDDFATELSKRSSGSWLENDFSLKELVDVAGYLSETREKLRGSNSSPVTPHTPIAEDEYEPTTAITTFCPGDDFSLSRSDNAIEEFAIRLQEGLDKQNSRWKGYIYHFTHLENAASIINSQSIFSRNYITKLVFKDSAGDSLIAITRDVVKHFARFYFRPLTPTQWHNELLGSRKNNIYALCPVPVFFKFKIADILKKYKTKCAVSNGNLASRGSCYGNSVDFLNYFNFGEVYGGSKIASQQEFLVKEGLNFEDLNASIICRSEQDRQALLNMIGSQSKYAHKIELDNSYYHNKNSYISVDIDGNNVKISMQRTSNKNIDGLIYITLKEGLNRIEEIKSNSQNIFRVLINKGMTVEGKDNFIVKFNDKPLISVYFQEKGKNWLIYTNEYRDHQG